MLKDLTKNERYLALCLAILVALVGLFLASTGRDTLLGSHGWIILVFGLILSFGLARTMTYQGPEPEELASVVVGTVADSNPCGRREALLCSIGQLDREQEGPARPLSFLNRRRRDLAHSDGKNKI